jgi:D-aspartate ligase
MFLPDVPGRATELTRGTAPILLTMAGYNGTLAAVRCLGALGVPITVADPQLFAPARWSRFATRRLFCPSVQDHGRFIAWLMAFGARSPGHVLYPTGDDVAWLYALHHQELSRYFHVYQPPVEVIYTLLNKCLLQQACGKVGIEMPRTWCLRNGENLSQIEDQLTFPLLVKPQTQILFWPHVKGFVAKSRESLRPTYEKFIAMARHAPLMAAYDPGVEAPLLQAYLPGATTSIYNLSGFVDESGELFVARASKKVLQRPRQIGVGLCFEEAETNHLLAQKLLALCRSVGYHGVFEVEFIESDGRFLLIDFNPRFYGQMAFDIARGVPLPFFAYQAALERQEQLRASVELARRSEQTLGARAYCNRMEFRLLLRLQRLAGGMDAAGTRRWSSWFEGHRRMTDAVLDPNDRGPGLAHLASHVIDSVRHPRSFVRQLASEE